MPIYPNLPLVIGKEVLHLPYHKEKKIKRSIKLHRESGFQVLTLLFILILELPP